MKRHLSIIFLLVFFILAVSVYYYTSAGPTAYDYFTRLADAFIQGKYWLADKPSWLTELIPWSEGINFVPYAPMPSLVALPFRFTFGNLFEQQYLAHLMGAGIAVGTMFNVYYITKNKLTTLWSGMLAAFGTIIWYLSATGSSWYLGQVSSAFFLTCAINVALTKKPVFLAGLLLGAAFLSRLHVILAFPYFLYAYFDRKNWFKNYFYFGLGILPYGLFNFFYNYIRFGTIFDQAYFLLPKTLNETDAPWFKYGVFNTKYISNNIKTMFTALPKLLDNKPFIEPSWNGLAIWITSPAFIYSLFAPLRKTAVQFIWLSIFLIGLVVTSHGGNGFAQFGYRFAVDFYPFLFLLMAYSLKGKKLLWHHWLFLFLSIIVNLWGVLWINKFGWVTF